jgi:hypothetical protein
VCSVWDFVSFPSSALWRDVHFSSANANPQSHSGCLRGCEEVIQIRNASWSPCFPILRSPASQFRGPNFLMQEWLVWGLATDLRFAKAPVLQTKTKLCAKGVPWRGRGFLTEETYLCFLSHYSTNSACNMNYCSYHGSCLIPGYGLVKMVLWRASLSKFKDW